MSGVKVQFAVNQTNRVTGVFVALTSNQKSPVGIGKTGPHTQ
jgi:hypothetical protein